MLYFISYSVIMSINKTQTRLL